MFYRTIAKAGRQLILENFKKIIDHFKVNDSKKDIKILSLTCVQCSTIKDYVIRDKKFNIQKIESFIVKYSCKCKPQND